MKKIVFSLFFYSITVYATPEGFELISGQVTPPQIDAQGQISMQSTQDSVVHWNSFSLSPQEVLIFHQAQETSTILNRVVGSDPSKILGKLQSNGIVYLINQNGILIGPGGVIETAGFLASTLDALTQDFFTKNTLEFFSENPGSIINLGTISCPVGQVTLLAQNIENQGEINGSLQAIACTKATLQIDNQRVFIQTNQEIDTPDNLQFLSGSIQKNPYAHAIKHSGRIQANTLGIENGRVYLLAQEGTTDITGSVEGTDIQLLGKEVLLKEQAVIDASSDTQGGKALIGGSYKGQGSDVPLAQHVLIDNEVQIHADARQTGDGGEIIIWSEESTEFLGSLSAKGGDLSGDGGFVEVSGKKDVTFNGRVDLTAVNGKTGNLLIDPDNIHIVAGGVDPATGQTFSTTGDVTISGLDIGIALASANLTLQANQDITIEDDLSTATANNLTLQAGGSITNSTGAFQILLNGGDFTAIFNDNEAASPTEAASFIANGTTIHSVGGNVVIRQGNLNNTFQGEILLDGVTLNTETGSIELTMDPNNNGEGITIKNSTVTAGDVALNGTGSVGIDCNQSSIDAASIHAIGTAKASDQSGINLVNSTWSASTKDITLEAQAVDSSGQGISLSHTGELSLVTTNGSITLNSIKGSMQADGAFVTCGGSGALTINSQQDCSLLSNQILLNDGDFTAIFNNDGAESSTEAASFIANDTTIHLVGGNVVIQQGNLNNTFQGEILLDGVTLNTETGSIELTMDPNNNGEGITIKNSTVTAGDVALNGTGSVGIDCNQSSIDAASIHAIGTAKASDQSGINLVNSTWSASTKDITLEAQAVDSSGQGISLSHTGELSLVTTNGSITLNSIKGSMQADGAFVTCGGSGALTINSQQDCSLLSNQILLNDGDFTAIFNNDGAESSTEAASFIANDTTIHLVGGNVVIQQGNLNNTFQGEILLDGVTLNTETGSIELTMDPNNNGEGITIKNSTVTAGDVALNGTGSVGIDCNQSSIDAASIHAIGTAKASDQSGINLVNSTWSASTKDITLEAQAVDSSGQGISLSHTGELSLVTTNGSITLNSIKGSMQADGAFVTCGGSGVLTVNAQQDCSLLSNQGLCLMLVDSGIAHFTIDRDLTLTSTSADVGIGSENRNLTEGSLQFTVGRNVSLLTTEQGSACFIGLGDDEASVNVTGDILFHHVGGDLTLQGASSNKGTAKGFAQIGHRTPLEKLTGSSTLNGNISLLVDGSISVIGGSASESSYAQIGHGGSGSFTTTGQLTAIAGRNILMQSDTAPANIINEGGDIILVTDNAFPTAPLIGPGFFSMDSNPSASSGRLHSSTGLVGIYTAVREQNQVNNSINDSPFVPGAAYENTTEEVWSTYYPGKSEGELFMARYKEGSLGSPFTMFYKDGAQNGGGGNGGGGGDGGGNGGGDCDGGGAFSFSVANAELFTILQNHLVNPPTYRAKLDYFSQRELMCFDPYRRVLRYRVDQKNLTR